MAVTVSRLLLAILCHNLWVSLRVLSALGADPVSLNLNDTLYFTLMVSSAPTLNTTGVVSAVDRVLDVINNDSNLLPGYRLQYSDVLDTQVCEHELCLHEDQYHCYSPPYIAQSVAIVESELNYDPLYIDDTESFMLYTNLSGHDLYHCS